MTFVRPTALTLAALLTACGNEAAPRHHTPGDNTEDGCLDEIYRETLPTTTPSITTILSTFASTPRHDFVLSLLAARYPNGAYIVEHAVDEYPSLDCVDWISGDATSAQETLGTLSTLVHECGHLLDAARAAAGGNSYFIRNDTTFACTDGDTTARGGQTFARSLITTDEFASDFPPCPGGVYTGCDSYAGIYLDGNPSDATFDSGDQGFNMLLEEAVQYVNSLASWYAFVDRVGSGNVNARDGILVFMWYLERYLHMARTSYPAAYDYILNDACTRDTVLTTWGRAWLYLDATTNEHHLGIDDATVLPLVNDPVLLDEIERLREASGCRN